MSPLVLSVLMHEGKSNWEPRQVGDWLGYLTNTIQMIFQVPVLKIEKPKAAAIHAVLNCQSVPVRDKLLFNDLVMVYKCLKNLTWLPSWMLSISSKNSPKSHLTE